MNPFQNTRRNFLSDIAIGSGLLLGRLTLFHCHQQLHMDYGLKMLFEAV